MDQAARDKLAAQLRQRMTASGLNQEQLARKIGVSKSMMSEILAGNARAGLTPVALKIVRAYPDLLSIFLSDIDVPYEVNDGVARARAERG